MATPIKGVTCRVSLKHGNNINQSVGLTLVHFYTPITTLFLNDKGYSSAFHINIVVVDQVGQFDGNVLHMFPAVSNYVTSEIRAALVKEFIMNSKFKLP
ncbi:unnamed protein product [Colias eurytheme]|nr:unnamed protein product [Colias eurytheme]